MARSVIAHVRIFRFVAELGRKFRITGVNPWNIARQKRIITLLPRRDRPEHDLEKPGNVSRGRTSQASHDSVAKRGRVTFVLVDLCDRHWDFRRGEKEVRQTAAKFSRWSVIIRRWILNVGESDGDETEDAREHQPSHS